MQIQIQVQIQIQIQKIKKQNEIIMKSKEKQITRRVAKES